MKDWGDVVYAPPAARRNDLISLPADEAHHLFRVRRIAVGGHVQVTDGDGLLHLCRVEESRELRIIESFPDGNEPVRPLILLCGALKGDTNRDVVDEATQLGAGRICFFQADHSEGRLSQEKAERLQRVAVTAIKQCGRARLPKIDIVVNLAAGLKQLPETARIFLAHPDGEAPEDSEDSDGAMVLIVGPEGGLSEREIMLVRQYRAQILVLGRRRLRAETAVCAGLSFLLGLQAECRIVGQK